MRFQRNFLLTIIFLLVGPFQALGYEIVKLGPSYFPESTRNRPVANGEIYVGLPDLDPEVIVNQQQLYVQEEDGDIIAVAQPIYTSAGGVPVYSGSPVTLLVNNDYSLKILNNSGTQVYYIPLIKSSESLGNAYTPDYNAADQGITGNNTIKYFVDLIGTANKATIFLRHNSGNATTPYTVTTAETIPANIKIEYESGAYIAGTVAFAGSPDAQIKALPGQQIFSSTSTITFGISGTIYSDWFGADNTGTIDASTATQKAVDALTAGGVLAYPGGTYAYTATDSTTGSVQLVDNLTIIGNGSLLKVTPITAVECSIFSAMEKDNITVKGFRVQTTLADSGLGSRASITYSGMVWNFIDCNNVVIEDNLIESAFDYVVAFGGTDVGTADGFYVRNNIVSQAGVNYAFIAYGTEGTDPTDFTKNVTNVEYAHNYVYGNRFAITLPITNLTSADASINGYANSTGHYRFDHVTNGKIIDNTSEFTAGEAIRVEQCENIVVSKNIIKNGNTPITCYQTGLNQVVSGNIINGWGWYPSAYALVTHGGVTYNCILRNSNKEPGVDINWASYWEVTTLPYRGSAPAWSSTTLYNKYEGENAIQIVGTSNAYSNYLQNVIVSENLIIGNSLLDATNSVQNYGISVGTSKVNKFGAVKDVSVVNNIILEGALKEGLSIWAYSALSDVLGFSTGIYVANNHVYNGKIHNYYGNEIKVDNNYGDIDYDRTVYSGNMVYSAFAIYDFSVLGGAAGTITLPMRLPDNASIIRSWYEIITPFTSGGAATVALGVATNDAAGLVGVTAYNNAAFNAGYHDTSCDGAAANYTTKTTAKRDIIMTVAGANLTAGKFYLYFEYIVSE